MLLLELPLVLVQDIVEDVVRSSDRFPALELRRVNRFFEEQATKYFAKHRMHDVCDGSRAMSDEMKCRFFRLYVGAANRRGLDAMQTHVHEVAACLYGLDSTSSIEDWMMNVCTAFARCDFGEHCRWSFRQSHSTSLTVEQAVDDGNVLSTSLVVAVVMNLSKAFESALRLEILPKTLNDPFLFIGNALEMACQWDSVDNVRDLLEAGAEPHHDSAIPRVFEHAIVRDYGTLVRLLLDRCGSKFPDARIKQSAEEAARLGKFAALEEFVTDYPALLSKDSSYAKNICYYVAWRGRNDMVKRCIAAGACDENRGYHLPLLSAIEKGHLRTCELILKQLKDDIAEGDHLTISRKLALGGNLKVLRLLQSKGVELKEPAHFFTVAADCGHSDLLRFAIRKGFHLDHTDPDMLQRFALLRSIKRHRLDTSEFLLTKLKLGINGSKDTGWDEIKITPLIMAIDTGCINQVRMLRRLGASADKSGVVGTDFCLKARKERYQMLFKSSVALKMIGWPFWEGKYAKQRMVDKALEAALSDVSSWQTKALARTARSWIRNLW